MQANNPQRHNGFSLLEMMVAIAIVAIVAALVTVSWTRWQGHNKHRFSEDKLLSELNGRRSLAVSERLSYKCQVDNASLICQRWTFNRDGYMGWHNKSSKHILDDSLRMKLAKNSPKKSHAIYFLSSGEIPPFVLEIWDHKNLLYRLRSNGTDVVEAGGEL
jgi:prepilin-type N-terminal cleavage/methylation domain-containing protein